MENRIMRIYAAYSGKMTHILPHFWLASFPHIFQKKSCYKPVSLPSLGHHTDGLRCVNNLLWQ